MIVETNRDVKWICRALEGFRSESAGRERQISAGVGTGAGGIVAVLMKFLQ